MKKDLFILAGPTAVGKTAISINLAKNLKGEIIQLIQCKFTNIWI
jgi:tRNA dimethylallyltransferase